MLAAVVVPLGLAPSLAAQPFPAGYLDMTLPNTTGAGSVPLAVRAYYPAQSTGAQSPLRSQVGGYPVLVFLHGRGFNNRSYEIAGAYFASRGYVVALPTSGVSAQLQFDDAIATHAALVAENVRPGAFLFGALDMQRVGICGHSMGGGNVVRTLASNPGFLAGCSLAPWDVVRSYPPAYSHLVKVPLAIVHGEGDRTVAWQVSALEYFQRAQSHTGIKLLYLMDSNCNHFNCAGLNLVSQADRDVWDRAAALAAGFFDHYLGVSSSGLEDVLGPVPQADPKLSQLMIDVEAPALWTAGAPRIGTTVSFAVAAEPGPAALLAAAGPAAISTPFGLLELDPATLALVAVGAAATAVPRDHVFSVAVAIPASPSLIGAAVSLQGLGSGTAAVRLTGSLGMLIVP